MLIPYLAIDYFRVLHSYTRINARFRENGMAYRYDSANYTRHISRLRFKAGLKVRISKRVWFDVFTGLGPRSREISISANNISETPGGIDYDVVWPTRYNDQEAGSFNDLGMALGFKFSFRLY